MSTSRTSPLIALLLPALSWGFASHTWGHCSAAPPSTGWYLHPSHKPNQAFIPIKLIDTRFYTFLLNDGTRFLKANKPLNVGTWYKLSKAKAVSSGTAAQSLGSWKGEKDGAAKLEKKKEMTLILHLLLFSSPAAERQEELLGSNGCRRSRNLHFKATGGRRGGCRKLPLSIPQPGPAAAGEGRKENPPGPGLPTTTGLSCGAAACTASLQMYYLLVAKGRWKCDLADGRCDHWGVAQDQPLVQTWLFSRSPRNELLFTHCRHL